MSARTFEVTENDLEEFQSGDRQGNTAQNGHSDQPATDIHGAGGAAVPVATPVLNMCGASSSAASSSPAGLDDVEVDGTSSSDAIFAKWKDEANGVLLWLARMPVDNVFPRPPPSPEVSDRKSGETLTVRLDEKLPEVFRKLVLEGFLSAPVVDSQSKYAGFIDMLDLVVFTLKIFAEGNIAKSTSQETGNATFTTAEEKNGDAADSTVWDEQSALAQFSRGTVQDAMRAHENELNPQHAISRGYSLFHAVEVMARSRAHRVAITDKRGKVSGILTQSMVISLLDQAMDSRFPTIASVPVSVLMADAHGVESIAETDPVINAFRKMVQKNITGLPVVNANGYLCDNISVRDLRGIGSDAAKWRRLFVSVKEYKDIVRTEYSRQTPHKPIFVQPTSTLAHVLKNTFDGNIYRVYVANAGRAENGDVVPLELLHVITQRDVLRFVLFLTLRLTAAKRLIAWWRGGSDYDSIAHTHHTHSNTLLSGSTTSTNRSSADEERADNENDEGKEGNEVEHTIELAQVHSAQHAIHAIEGNQLRPAEDTLTG